MQIDIEEILQEWGYRCRRGYPVYGDSQDMVILREVLAEMNVDGALGDINTIIPTLISEAPSAITLYPKSLVSKLTAAGKLEKFTEFVNSIPGGDAPAKVSDGITRICANKSYEDVLVKLFKAGKSLKDLVKVNPSEGVPGLLFNVRPSGTGPGEVLISWVIENAAFQGGTVSYDIDYAGEHWEVKSLVKASGGNGAEPIDPANYGKISGQAGKKLTQQLQGFFEHIIDPYYDNKLRDGIMALSEDATVKHKLDALLIALESMPRTSADGSRLLSSSIGEMTSVLFNKFYVGLNAMHKSLPASVRNTAKASRIAVKSSTTDAQFWIDPKDADDITKNAGKDKEVAIKVGTEITDENKEAKIWLSHLMNNQFVRNPESFITQLREIRDGFAVGKAGLIYITKGKFNLSNSMEDFFTSGITRGTYRFSLKNQNRYAGYTYAQEQ